MQAMTQREYGDSSRLALEELPDPTPGPHDVLVAVRAAGVDRGTWHLMTGQPYAVRLAFGLRRPKFPVPGRDVAGVVVATGTEVTAVAVGDEVMGTADGSFAELAVVPESRVAPKPTALDFAEAATVPVSGLTALQALRKAGDVGPGTRVLVLGASGGVGSYAVQIAAAYGAEVTGVASGAKRDLVLGLGATRALDYARDDIGEAGPFDVILDIAGRRPLSLLRRWLTPTGSLVIVGGEGGDRLLGGTHRQFAALALDRFTRQRLTSFISSESAEDLRELTALAEAGSLRPALERTFALDQAAKAIDHVASGQARGKVAIAL